jgi:hypothetical protein
VATSNSASYVERPSSRLTRGSNWDAIRAFSSTIAAGPRSGTKNSTLKSASSSPCASTISAASAASSARRSASSRVGYSNRSKLIVPG